jgi:hypothetical protein
VQRVVDVCDGAVRLAEGVVQDIQERRLPMKTASGSASASASVLIDGRIKELGDWRGRMLAEVRGIMRAADPEIVEEWKWRGVPVWSHGGIVCTGETYKEVVKMTFAKGAALPDPAGLFNSSMEGNVRRAIDIREGEEVNAAALRELVRAAVALNLESKGKSRSPSGMTTKEAR